MAGETGHARLAAEVLLVDRVHHHDHLARALNPRGGDGESLGVGNDLLGVAAHTVEEQRRGEHAHRVEEFVRGNALQDLDVLKDLFRHPHGALRLRILLRRCLNADRRQPHEADGRRKSGDWRIYGSYDWQALVKF